MRFVHQNPGVFADLTVAENIAIGHGFPTGAGRIRWAELRRRTQALIDRFEIRATPDTPVGALSPAHRTMVAVARALQDQDELSGGVLVLDEPTTSLPAAEIDVLLTALRRCAAQGQTIAYVSHRIDEVLALADRITVLRDGHRVATAAAPELSESSLIEHISNSGAARELASAGRALAHAGGTVAAPTSDEVVLELRGVSAGPLREVDLRVRRGEVLGVAGLLGSGRSTLLRTVFGAVRPTAGEVRLGSAPLRVDGPAGAIAAGIAYVPRTATARRCSRP